jgi:phospholipid/cholesterol/gamma-HCH transport system substrate-binding protein
LTKTLNQNGGSVNALLKDTLMADRLRNTILNLEQGTDAFNQNMEALKHNFLVRKYFKKMEKQQKKQ